MLWQKRIISLHGVLFVGSHVCRRIIGNHRAHVGRICSWQSRPLYSQNGGSLPCPSYFSLLPNHLILSCHIRHFHSKHPIYLTTPCPSTNCRRSAAHPPHSCRSHTSWLCDGDRIKQLQEHIIYGSTRFVCTIVIST